MRPFNTPGTCDEVRILEPIPGGCGRDARRDRRDARPHYSAAEDGPHSGGSFRMLGTQASRPFLTLFFLACWGGAILNWPMLTKTRAVQSSFSGHSRREF